MMIRFIKNHILHTVNEYELQKLMCLQYIKYIYKKLFVKI